MADAVLIPQEFKTGRTFKARVDSIADIAEPLLGIDRAAGGRAYARPAFPGSKAKLFVTASPEDSLCFGTTHPRSGLPRYHWSARADGIELGTLVTDAEADDMARQPAVSAMADNLNIVRHRLEHLQRYVALLHRTGRTEAEEREFGLLSLTYGPPPSPPEADEDAEDFDDD